MDKEIANFMLKAAKFEFFLVNHNQKFCHVDGTTKIITGVNWDCLGQSLEALHPFNEFDFASSGFQIFRETVPQFLVAKGENELKWDSDDVVVSSWQVLLRRGYAQLRNNVAHGNKAQLSAPFTEGRSKEFIEAGHLLIDFVAGVYSPDGMWSYAVQFKS